MKLLHAIEVPLCVISVFKYSVANFDKRLSSTIFLIGFQIASSLGIVLLSTPTGILFDRAGYQTVFFAISGIVCLMLLFGIFFLSKKTRANSYGNACTFSNIDVNFFSGCCRYLHIPQPENNNSKMLSPANNRLIQTPHSCSGTVAQMYSGYTVR